MNVAQIWDQFHVKVFEDQPWTGEELEALETHLALFSSIIGGRDTFFKIFGEFAIERADTGSSLGLAYVNKIRLNEKTEFTAWSVLHELAHVWDAKHGWGLSRQLERYTGGFTNKMLSAVKRWIPGQWDAVVTGPKYKPGLYGRKPGCNSAGYFYGDKPSGSNWNFNRKEDFAESVVMYCGWGRDNALSRTARGRIERYLLPNGMKDPIYGIADNWSDYARYFYSADGDYKLTKRWKFVDQLINK